MEIAQQAIARLRRAGLDGFVLQDDVIVERVYVLRGGDFDETCLAVTPSISPAAIKELREANKVSQPVFARYLNTSESTVEKWETGAKKPSGAALKLLSIVQKHGLQILA